MALAALPSGLGTPLFPRPQRVHHHDHAQTSRPHLLEPGQGGPRPGPQKRQLSPKGLPGSPRGGVTEDRPIAAAIPVVLDGRLRDHRVHCVRFVDLLVLASTRGLPRLPSPAGSSSPRATPDRQSRGWTDWLTIGTHRTMKAGLLGGESGNGEVLFTARPSSRDSAGSDRCLGAAVRSM